MLTILFAFIVLSISAQERVFITTAKKGGINNEGTILVADSNGNNFQSVYSFVHAIGRWPVGSMAFDQNGMAYGVTKLGGLGDSCVIYKYDIANHAYTLLHDFYVAKDSGWWDHSGPILLSDGKLYGIGQAGGLYNGGAIYRLDPANSFYESLFDFDSLSGKVSSGRLLYLSDGKLYGTTSQGGAHNRGTIFRFDPVSYAYTVLHHFVDSTGYNTGYGSLIQGTDGKLYGVTKNGGPGIGLGSFFSYDVVNNVFTCHYLFSSILNGAGFNNPLVHAPNGLFYGLANQGGSAASKGALYSFDIQNNTYTKLTVFDGTNGAKPESGLTLASNGKLYGTTTEGGTTNNGLVFSYDIDSSQYSIIYEFDSVTGSAPSGMVMETTLPAIVGVSTDELNADIQVVPNPSASSVQVSAAYPIRQLTMTDLSGKESFITPEEITPQLFRIDGLEKLANGVYLLNIDCGNVQRTIKLLLQK